MNKKSRIRNRYTTVYEEGPGVKVMEEIRQLLVQISRSERMSLIKEIVNNLPYLLIYYVPGFCTIFAYRRFRSARSFAMSETVHLGACVVISYIINLFLEVVWPTSESAGLEVTGLKCILAIIVGVGIAFALVKLRGWRKARQLYADKLKSSLSDTVFEASELADDVYVTVYGEKSECRAD